MTLTELKIKLAEQCLPNNGVNVTRTEYGDLKWVKDADYELAEKILYFLKRQGVNLPSD